MLLPCCVAAVLLLQLLRLKDASNEAAKQRLWQSLCTCVCRDRLWLDAAPAPNCLLLPLQQQQQQQQLRQQQQLEEEQQQQWPQKRNMRCRNQIATRHYNLFPLPPALLNLPSHSPLLSSPLPLHSCSHSPFWTVLAVSELLRRSSTLWRIAGFRRPLLMTQCGTSRSSLARELPCLNNWPTREGKKGSEGAAGQLPQTGRNSLCNATVHMVAASEEWVRGSCSNCPHFAEPPPHSLLPSSCHSSYLQLAG